MHLQGRGQVWNEEEQNHSFADYGQTVRDMNKCHNTDPISWGSSSKRAHIGRLREFFFQKLQKTPPKWRVCSQKDQNNGI